MSIAQTQRMKEIEAALAELRARVAALEQKADRRPLSLPKKDTP